MCHKWSGTLGIAVFAGIAVFTGNSSFLWHSSIRFAFDIYVITSRYNFVNYCARVLYYLYKIQKIDMLSPAFYTAKLASLYMVWFTREGSSLTIKLPPPTELEGYIFL